MALGEYVTTWSDRFAARARGDVGEGLASILSLANVTDIISFSGGFPDPATFPGQVLADLLRELIGSGDASAMQYAPTRGLPGVREYVASRLHRMEGVLPTDSELMITSGAIEAMELIGKSFLDPGDVVLVEGPTYLGAIMAFRSFQAEVTAISMDDGGLRVDMLEEVLSARGGGRVKLLYAIPDHQNPAGVSLASDRREALIGLARTHGFLIVEDVAYRELGFDEERPPSLWSIGPDVVVQIGTFSKTFFPGVRLGWAAGPAEVVAQLVAAKQNTDQCAGALGQRLLEEYGRRGHLDEQIVRARALYRRRCGALMQAMEEHMPEGVAWTRPRGGFFSWVTVNGTLDTAGLAERALAQRVAYVPGAAFFPDGRGGNRLRLAFSRVEDSAIPEGVKRLGMLIREALREEGPVR